MSVDKLVDSTQLDSDLTSVANAIRTRGGTSSDLSFPSGFVSAVGAIGNTYSASDEGKVVDNGALVAQTAHADVTPTTSDQTIDTTTNNSIKVKGDADLVATNIKKDVEIFGVTGSYEGGGGVILAPMDYSVTFTNSRSGTIAIIRVLYNATTLIGAVNENLPKDNSVTYNNMLTDGTHFWFRCTGSNVSYNGSPATYAKDSSYFMVTIPAGFDGTIPFIIT